MTAGKKKKEKVFKQVLRDDPLYDGQVHWRELYMVRKVYHALYNTIKKAFEITKTSYGLNRY
jgi:hypothetical protein